MAPRHTHVHADRLLEQLSADAVAVLDLIREGSQVMMQKSHRNTRDRVAGADAPGDPMIRGLGTHSDPTGDAACDPKRLALSTAVQRAARDLAVAHATMNAHRMALGRALDRWSGATPD